MCASILSQSEEVTKYVSVYIHAQAFSASLTRSLNSSANKYYYYYSPLCLLLPLSICPLSSGHVLNPAPGLQKPGTWQRVAIACKLEFRGLPARVDPGDAASTRWLRGKPVVLFRFRVWVSDFGLSVAASTWLASWQVCGTLHIHVCTKHTRICTFHDGCRTRLQHLTQRCCYSRI
jgi:hypothetical protein